MEDLKRLARFVGTSSESRIELLPIFYVHLDAKKIPYSSSPTSNTIRTLEPALTSLQGVSSWAQAHLLKEKAPIAEVESSWPAMWKWISFFLSRCIKEISKLADFSTNFMRNSYVTCIQLLDILANDEGLRLTIATTSGVISMLAKLWMLEAKIRMGSLGTSRP